MQAAAPVPVQCMTAGRVKVRRENEWERIGAPGGPPVVPRTSASRSAAAINRPVTRGMKDLNSQAISNSGRRFLRVVFHVQQAAMLLGLKASHLTEQTLKAQLVATARRITAVRHRRQMRTEMTAWSNLA